MRCPNCGTSNIVGAHFCGNCGAELPVGVAPSPSPVSLPPLANPITSPATISGLAALVGGVLVVIGWLMPWFGLGQGYGYGSGVGSLLSGFSAGIASGLQLALITLLSGLASLGLGGNSSIGVVIGLIALASCALLVVFPILGALNIRAGNTTYAMRHSTNDVDRQTLSELQNQIRSRSISGLILLVVIYALVSLIPFLTNALGGGFFVTAIAFGISFLGAFLSK